MKHLGVLSYAGAGHLNPMIALSKELAGRGHRVTLFLPPQFEQKVCANGLGFVPIAVPKDTECLPTQAEFNGASGWSHSTRARITHIDAEIGGFLAEYPSAIRDAGVDALIMDEIVFAGPTVAELLVLPYVVLSTSIPHNFGWDAPSVPIDGSWQRRLERKMLEVSIFRMRGPIRICLDHHRQRLGLASINTIGHAHPHVAHITQWPECLDSPRPGLPANFYYTGPFATSRRTEEMEFPWDRLDGRPLIYASLGTTKKAAPSLFYGIAEACADLDVQLVMTLGGGRDRTYFIDIPGDPILVQAAPQLELLSRADAVITHAGPNTVLEALLHGKPMIALPLTLDQPAVADRISRAGAAEVLSLERRSSVDIRTNLLKILGKSSYREAARALQKQLATLEGVFLAAHLVECALDASHSMSPMPGALQTIHQSV